MPHVTGTIPNLINGVSQQAATLRLPSQGSITTNYYPTIVDGLTPRPRTDFLARLLVDLPEGTFCQFILRDKTEKYVFAIYPNGTLKVWDLEGMEKTVTNSGSSYLTATNPEQEYRALTVADYTFIVNKKKVVAAGSATEPSRPYEALIGVLAGNYGKKYRVNVNGSWLAEYATPDGSDASQSPYIDTVYIADQLYQDLDAAGCNTAPWDLGRYHSTLYLRNATTDFTIATEDGYSGRAMKEVKGTLMKFADLPQHGPDGVVVKITGDENTGFDDYWVKFNKTNDANGFGVWKECVAPGAKLGLDPATMPHTLVRESDGTFTFGPAEWTDRVCGDENAVPDPSFVGQTIEDVFFHRNRLGMLTKENYVLSQSQDFFNFYRTTLTALLDTDPIDGAASHVKVSLLRHAVPYSEVLLLFSDQTQFRLDGNDLLTPKTVNAKPLSELSSEPLVRPVVAGSSVYFVAEGANWASLYEYYIDKNIQSAEDENVSGHAPSYVPAGVRRMIASPDLDLVCVITSGEPNAIYIYKFYWNGQEKLQSAWAKWTFPGVDEILTIDFDRKTILAFVRRGDEAHIERLNAEQGVSDPGSEYITYLDRHVLIEGSDATYDDETDITTFTLPYAAPEGLKCVTAPGGSIVPGVELPPADVDDNLVMFEGDLTDVNIRFGTEFSGRYRFSPFYTRSQDGKTSDPDGRLTILGLTVMYAKSAYFRVEVTAEGRAMRTYPFTGRIVGDVNNKTGELPLDTGRWAVPVMSRNDRVTIDIVFDTWRPCAFTSAKWRGVFNPSNREQ